MKAVLKFGGSILAPKSGVNVDFIKELSQFLIEQSKKHELAVVVGAGKLSREYGEIGRKFTQNEDLLDMIGIMVARLNASLLITALGDHACPKVPHSEEKFLNLSKEYPGKIIVSGGFRPRQRTDAVAIEIAEKWGAEIVIKGTNVNYVYDKDPNKFTDAKPLKNISYEQLKELGDQKHMANSATIIDSKASKLLAEKKMKLAIVNGTKLDNIAKILAGKSFVGTKIGF